MPTITLAAPDDFDGWRTAARSLVAAAVPPSAVTWMVAGEAGDLLGGDAALPPATEPSFTVPKAFIEMARRVVCNAEAERFALLHAALAQLDLRTTRVPAPLNLWMNIPIDEDGIVTWGEPLSRRGDSVTLRAAMDCVVVLSACPQDMVPINGLAMTPTEAHFQIVG